MEGLKGELVEGWAPESSRMKAGAGAGSLRSSWMERGAVAKALPQPGPSPSPGSVPVWLISQLISGLCWVMAVPPIQPLIGSHFLSVPALKGEVSAEVSPEEETRIFN